MIMLRIWGGVSGRGVSGGGVSLLHSEVFAFISWWKLKIIFKLLLKI